jgi:signal transduction histidine kinase
MNQRQRHLFFLLAVLFIFSNNRFLYAQSLPGGGTNDYLEIQSVTVAGKTLPIHRNNEVNLGASPDGITFHFGPETNATRLPMRLVYKLDDYENTWHGGAGGGGEMYLAVRFYNKAGEQVSQNFYYVHGDSAGWNHSLKNSSLTHRRETLTAPPLAARLMVVVSSAGPPATEGVYVVANLTATKSTGNLPPAALIQSPLDQSPDNVSISNLEAHGWVRDGTTPGMSKIVNIGHDPAIKAFAILDEDPIGHAEWRNTIQFAPKISPGDDIAIEWNEMFSMGLGDFRTAGYGKLPAGTYKFELKELDMFGNPTGAAASLKVIVPAPFWQTPWFWGVLLAGAAALVFAAGRYLVRQKLKREMAHLKNQQALERERLRIAHDIHDDLGARVTQISLLSALSQDNPAFPEKARADFDQISRMSRELVSALYQTVWAVNPENDNLDALGNYLCQMVNQLCERSQFRCRFHLSHLPATIQVSSQTRHNISMAVKEAVHNVIKHANASEVAIHVTLTGNFLTILVQDDGHGFQPGAQLAGHGLNNMKRRLEDIGGNFRIESQPGKGTVVRLEWSVKSPAADEAGSMQKSKL